MTETQEFDSKSYLKISQLCTALREYRNEKYFIEILNREGDINYRITSEITHLPNITGCTILIHALINRNISIFNLLVNHGADFTIKDDSGSTVLHHVIEEKYKISIDSLELKNKVEDSFIDSILSFHIQLKINENPCSGHGLTHFHAACITNNTKAVRFFLKNGVSVNQKVNNDSAAFAGYTPLHFASRFCALETAEILLEYGARTHDRDVREMTPLHVLMERNIKIMHLDEKRRRLHCNLMTIEISEKMIKLLLENDPTSPTETDHFGFSKFHVACNTPDSTLAKRFLKYVSDINHTISPTSPIAPGSSAFHLAALSSIDTAKILSSKGANILAKDVNGVTPLDLCLQKYKNHVTCDILNCQIIWKDILLSDGKTKLLDLLLFVSYEHEFRPFLYELEDINASVDSHSPLWPNYTILHVIITLYHKNKDIDIRRRYLYAIKYCLDIGASVIAEKVHCHTVLHFAFKLQEKELMKLLFQYHKFNVNPIDDNGWSQFHIACTLTNEYIVDRFLKKGVDVNCQVKSDFRMNNCYIRSHSTALHIVITIGSYVIAKRLLEESNIDIYVKDADGLTTVHYLMMVEYNLARKIFSKMILETSTLQEHMVDGFGHLHVACFLNFPDVIKRLPCHGANVNVAINHTRVSEYVGFTPLRIAMRQGHWPLALVLIQHGADTSTPIQVKDVNIRRLERIEKPFITAIADNIIRIEGLNLIHIACEKNDPRLLEDAVKRGVNVNGKIKGGLTPLHMFIKKTTTNNNMYLSNEFSDFLELLLFNGADVSLMDDNMQTPLLLCEKIFHTHIDIWSINSSGSRLNLMLMFLRDFSVNPVNADGMSHFHIACSWNNETAVEKFLKTGLDVNQTIERLSGEYTGCTPLHMTLNYQPRVYTPILSQFKTIELLLKYGAYVNAEDSRGNTPLHLAAKYSSPRIKIFELLADAGANISAKNIYGETPFEILLKSENVTVEEIEFFLSRGCCVNDYNPITQKGYIPLTFSMLYHTHLQELILETMLNAASISEVDDTGCTAIHNVVSISLPLINNYQYTELIERLMELGCDLDYQDKLGQTALHIAAQFHNESGMLGLLSAGADMNIIDASGKPAFAYGFEACCKVFNECQEHGNQIRGIFAEHIKKLIYNHIDIDEHNQLLWVNLQKEGGYMANFYSDLDDELKIMKNTKIGSSSLCLHDFLSETDAVIAYSNKSLHEREEINNFFKSNWVYLTNTFTELASVLKLQYRKALARHSLIEKAKESFNNIIGFSLPDPCNEAIFISLKNSELKNLIESNTSKTDDM